MFKKILKYTSTTLLIILLLTLGLGIGGAIFMFPKMKAMYEESVSKVESIKEDTFRPALTTIIYDDNNEELLKLKKENKESYYLDFAEIPKDVLQSFISTEDKRFYTHRGVDWKGTFRAVLSLIKNKGEITQGGSTITQQLTRNVFLSHEQSYERKIKEIMISLLIEKKYDKEEILEFYVNSIYFANGAYGIEAASTKYFNKSAKDLNLAETAFLCAIPNNPTLYNPLKRPENVHKRKERILGYLLEDGYITQEQKEEANNFEIKLSTPTKAEELNGLNSFLIDDATRKLMHTMGFVFKNEFKSKEDKSIYQNSYDNFYSLAQKELYTGGYRIHTSINKDKQKLLQDSLDNELKSFTEKNKEDTFAFQGAATSIDNATGRVVAIVGGRTQEESQSNGINRAFQSFRQPGSIFKPVAVYTPAFERGYLPAQLQDDSPIANGPRNYDGNFEGPMTIREAVAKSKNTIAWKIFDKIGPKTGMQYIKNMNFQKIDDRDNYLSSSLGGLTYGASTMEMASAYATIARDGYFVDPTSIAKISTAKGELVYENNEQPKSIYQEKAARIMTNTLQSVMTAGTGKGMNFPGMPLAGKTGSTNDLKDGWFAGYSPYYTTVVWCGYDIPRKTSFLYGSSYPGRIWKNYMSKIHKGLPYKEFNQYANLKNEEAAFRKEAEEELKYQKLITSINSKLESFKNYNIFTADDIQHLKKLSNELKSLVAQLKTQEEKNKYLTQIKDRDKEIDEIAKTIDNKPTPPPVVEPTPPPVVEPTPPPVVEPTPPPVVEPTPPPVVEPTPEGENLVN